MTTGLQILGIACSFALGVVVTGLYYQTAMWMLNDLWEERMRGIAERLKEIREMKEGE